MSTYVLVYGSWHGGWCWGRASRLLRNAGHDVWAPTLTGLGDRSHLAGPGVDLSAHIADTVGLVAYEDLDDVVLVGASYGGAVISAVAARFPERVRHLVFVDGLVPAAGQSCFDLMPGVRAGFVERAHAAVSDWAVPPPPPEFFGIVDPDDATWAAARLTSMSLATHDEPLPAPPPETTHGTYVRCDRFEGFDPQMAHAIDRGYRILHVDAGHDVQVINPRLLTDVLSSL